jgi:hypothetical protein
MKNTVLVTLVLMLFLVPQYSKAEVPLQNKPASTTPVQSPNATQQTPNSQTAVDTLQKNFQASKQQNLLFAFGVTQPGPIYIDVSWQGPPISVSLRNEVYKNIVSTVNGNTATVRLAYTISSSDLQKGLVWSAVISSTGNANGTVRIIYPKADTSHLSTYLNSLPAQQKTMLTSALNDSHTTVAAAQLGKQDFVVPFKQRAFVVPELERDASSNQPMQPPKDISSQVSVSKGTPIPFKPFALNEVFDMKTGKPFFAQYINEKTGELLNLPHQPNAKIFRTKPTSINEFKRRNLHNISIRPTVPGGLGKIGTEPFTANSLIQIPRHDNTSLVMTAEQYVNEINNVENALNTIGKSLRDTQTGGLRYIPREQRMGAVSQNQLLLMNQAGILNKSLIKAAQPPALNIRSMSQPPRIDPSLFKTPINLSPPPTLVAPPQQSNLGKLAHEINYATKCIIKNIPDGGIYGEDILIEGVGFYPDVCKVYFESGTGSHFEVNAQQVDSTHVKVTVPKQIRGRNGGIITIHKDYRPEDTQYKSDPKHYRHFYIGSDCSLESISQQRAMPSWDITATVGRFQGCQLAFTSSTGKQVPVAFNHLDEHTIKFRMPLLDKGVAQTYAARSGKQTRGPDINVIELVVDSNGVPAPPDYFKQNIQPFVRPYSWSSTNGDTSNFNLGLSANFSISSKGDKGDNLLAFEGNAQEKATLFGSDFEILGAHASASVPTVSSIDPKLRANFNVSLGGFPVYQWGRTKNKDGEEKRDEQCDDKFKDGSGKCKNCDDSLKDRDGLCCDDYDKEGKNKNDKGACRLPDGYSVKAQLTYENDIVLFTLDKSVGTKIWVGPIPITAKIGFTGNAGVKFAMKLTPLQVAATVTPHIDTHVYAQCAIDVFLASAGAGVDMTLANLELVAGASLYLDFGKSTPECKKPALVTDLSMYYKYNLLSGYVYLYAEALSERWTWEIYRWDGFTGLGYLLPPKQFCYSL